MLNLSGGLGRGGSHGSHGSRPGGGGSASRKEESTEQVKKYLRALSDCAAKIDESTSKCVRIGDLFATGLVKQRQKLRDISFAALKTCPDQLNVLDLNWRKTSYEVISTAKRLRKGREWDANETAFLVQHLTNSSGHYQNILLWLDRFKACSNQDYNHEVEYGFIQLESNSKPSVQADDKTVQKASHKCMMFLGDLHRYKLEFWTREEKQTLLQVTKRFYHQALSVNPGDGMPFNQLAALYSSDSYGLVSTFYYLRCMTASKVYTGAEGNLKLLLEKNTQRLAKIEVSKENNDNGDDEVKEGRDDKVMIIYLLDLTRELLFEDSTKKLSELCQKSLCGLHGCLYNPNMSSRRLQMTTYQVLVLILVLSKAGNSEIKQKVTRAYLVALFTNITTKILADLTLELYGPEALIKAFEDNPEPEEENDLDAERDKKSEGTPTKQSKKKGDRRRRRIMNGRAGSDSSVGEEVDSDESAQDSSDEEDLSETESESENDDDENGLLESDSFDDDSDSEEDVIIEEAREIVTTMDLVNEMATHPLIESFCLSALWLQENKSVIHEAGENCYILWKRLCTLFNTANLDNDSLVKDDHVSGINIDNLLKIPFPEDKLSKGIGLFSGKHDQVEFDAEVILTKHQKGVLRLKQLGDMKDWLCRHPQCGISLDEEGQARFDPANIKDESDNTPKVEQQNIDEEEKENEKKEAVMTSMAQLWLQQEVEDLERGGRAGQNGYLSQYSPYLVIDHFALIRNTNLVKDVVSSKRFAVIIPKTVVQELDGMKKDDIRARHAIRWLEKQFQEGNRYLRSQKENEAKSLEMVTYPKKKESKSYFKILECCQYFVSQRAGAVASKNITSVTLITSDKEENDAGEKDLLSAFQPPLETARFLGVGVETIEDFVAKNKIAKFGKSNKTKKRGRAFKKENG